MQDILKRYGDLTGQMVNLDKSSITFRENVDEDLKKQIHSRLGITNVRGTSSYLSLPECFSGSKVDMLNFVKEKIKVRFSSWFSRTLSQGGKEVLLKSAAMGMPVYAMSCFKLPKTTCDNLISAMSSFWWSSVEEKKKIHWVSWEHMCLPKRLGGIGFKDIHLFNQALLAKQAWRLTNDPDCLLARFLRSRYYNDSEFEDAKIGKMPSFGWRSILYGKELLDKGLKKMIGDGRKTLVWASTWIDDGNRFRALLMKNQVIDIDLRVSSLLNQQTGEWDKMILDDMFYPDDVALILKMKIAQKSEDFKVWKFNKSGAYSTKSGYWLGSSTLKSKIRIEAETLPSLNPLKEKCWFLKIPSKLRVFLWECLSNALPVAEGIARRGMKVDERCQLCGHEPETANHIFFSCPLARRVWAEANFPLQRGGFHPESIFHNINHLLTIGESKRGEDELYKAFPWLIWRLWKNRNDFIFEGKIYEAIEIVNKALEDWREWSQAQADVAPCEESSLAPTMNAKPPWEPPLENWLKCDVGIFWCRHSFIAGVAWVLRE